MALGGINRCDRSTASLRPIHTPTPLASHDRSEHEVNTARSVLKSSSMRHVEGGWPKDVDAAEQADVTRFRKKVGMAVGRGWVDVPCLCVAA